MVVGFVTQILIWIALSMIIGTILGYWFRSMRRKEEIAALNKNWKTSYDLLREELVHAQKELSHPDYDAEAESNKVFENMSATSRPDDLTKIRGIARTIEERLNSLGIFRYEQLASLTNMEIEEISQYLGPFPDRIRRDNWIMQAKILAAKH